MRIEVGDHVMFVDERRRHLPAIVTATWHGNQPEVPLGEPAYALNVTVVDPDPSKRDQYGQQLRRPSSVPHWRMNQQAGGYCWYHPGLEPVETKADGSIGLKQAA